MLVLAYSKGSIKGNMGGFLGGSVVKNPSANAGDMSSVPDPGRSREPQLLSLCSRAAELQLLNPCAAGAEGLAPRARAPPQEKPPQWEACAWRLE